MKYTIMLNDIGDIITIISFKNNEELLEKINSVVEELVETKDFTLRFSTHDLVDENISNSNLLVTLDEPDDAGPFEYSLTETPII